MKILIIKMTSMGDILHTFPALTDAGNTIKNISFDWLVEESFQELPKWHSRVDQVIPVAFRRWRKTPLKTLWNNEILKKLIKARENKYDLIIDAQGLLKSNLVALAFRGKRVGFDKKSVRESWINFIYHEKIVVDRQQHAVTRLRELFAKALNYSLPQSIPDYGLDIKLFTNIITDNYLMFIPNTTWETKQWPEAYWSNLIEKVVSLNYKIYIPWGNEIELARAKRLAAFSAKVEVLPRMNLQQIAAIIMGAKAVITLDTGLAHLAAAFAVPTLTLYGSTHPKLTGTMGLNQKHLAAEFICAPCLQRKCNFSGKKWVDPPCYSSLPPEKVWVELQQLLTQNETAI